MARDSQPTFEVGDRYINPAQSNWNVGQVLSVSGNQVALFFLGAGKRIFLANKAKLTPAPTDHRSDALDCISGFNWGRVHHNLYVVELRSAVRGVPRFHEANLGHDSQLPCLYVGITGHTPEERYENHKRGHKSSGLVKNYHMRLVPNLYERFNPMPYELARQLEPEYTLLLQSQGYAVWSN